MGSGQARLDCIRETLRIGSYLLSSNFIIIKPHRFFIVSNMPKFCEISWKIMIFLLKILVWGGSGAVFEEIWTPKTARNHPKPRFWEEKSWLSKISHEILTCWTPFFSMSFYEPKIDRSVRGSRILEPHGSIQPVLDPLTLVSGWPAYRYLRKSVSESTKI